MIGRKITGRLADVAIRHRPTVFVLFAVFTAMGMVLSQNLDLVVEPEQLLGEDNAVARQFFEVNDAFGNTTNLMMIVEGEDRQETIRAAHAVVDRVRADRDLNAYFKTINLEIDAEYALQWGLMLAEDPEDAETMLRLLEQRSLLGFVTTLNDTLEEVVLSDDDRFATNQDQWDGLAALSGIERLTATIEDSLTGNAIAAGNASHQAAREIMESVLVGERYSWSPDQEMLMVSLLPAFDVLDLDSLHAAVAGVEKVAEQVDREIAGVSIGMGGELAWVVARHEGASADTLYPTLVALGLIVVLFFFSFTRLRKMALALLALVVGIIITVGGIALTVGHISMITSIFAVILMGLGIDFGIHLVSNYDDFRLKGVAPVDAMRKTMIAGGTPIMLGGFTTACAFFSLALSSSPAVAEFGIVSGMGVLITLGTMLTLFPALVLALGGRQELRRAGWRPMIDFSFMTRLGRGIEAHPYVAIVLSLALTVAAVALIPRNTVDFDPMNNSPRNHRYTRTQQRIIDRMEVSPFISFSTRNSLEEARELTEAFRRQRTVSRAVSAADLLPPADEVEKRLARIAAGGPAGPLAAGDVAGYRGTTRSEDDIERLADEIQRLEWNVIELGDLAVAGMGEGNLVQRRRDLMVREIIGAEVGEPGREVFQNAIAAITADPAGAAARMASIDEAFARIMETQQRHMSVERAPTVADLSDDLRHQLVSADGSRFLITVFPTRDTQDSSESILAYHTAMTSVDPGITGSVPVYVELVTEIFSEATRAGIYVAAVVFVLLLIIFRRISHVILAFTMVVMGILWMFGLLPLTGTQLGLTAGLVFPLLIGIGTDDAMHILHRYNHEGGRIVPAIRYSGKAVLLTTVTTMLAFGSLAVVGEMATIAAIGWLLFVGLGTCFLATVILLPACLSVGKRWRSGQRPGRQRHSGERRARNSGAAGNAARIAALALFPALLWLAPAVPAAAQSRSAEEVMREVDAQRDPETARSRMTMRIYSSLDADSHDREIRLLSYSRSVTDSLIEFVSPRSIAGLRVLDLDGAVRVFFPSTGRVRNIGGAGRRSSVGGVGGDFSYEDMGGGGFINDYHQFQMKEETSSRWVIAAVPRDDDSQYSRLVFHVNRENYVPVQIDYFENGTQVKRLEASRIQEIDGRNVATHLVMHNMKEDSRTEIRMHDVEWDVPLSADLFHPNRFHR